MVQRMHEANPSCAVVLLVDGDEPRLTVEAMRAGASGVFFRSDFESAALCKMRSPRARGADMDQEQRHTTFGGGPGAVPFLQSRGCGRASLLTNREQDVVRLVVEGLGNREIAQQLSLSQHTVKNYLFHIFDKLGISNRVESCCMPQADAKKFDAIQLTKKPKSGLEAW